MVPKYTIEGHVTDKQGTVLGGVVIDIGGHTIVTDANGYYQLTELKAGNYTLVAAHDQYDFTPKKPLAKITLLFTISFPTVSSSTRLKAMSLTNRAYRLAVL